MTLSVIRTNVLEPAKRWYFKTAVPMWFRLVNIGNASSYCIIRGYRHRQAPIYLDTKSSTDEWQREVYLHAKHIMEGERLSVVYDIGCGSGYKLIEYLGMFNTIGFDVKETVEFLQSRYPRREWRVACFEDRTIASPDLAICADVIEHVGEPNQLVEFIHALDPRYAIFSTPDRELCYRYDDPARFGPPRNPAHLREWNLLEFRRYISQRFEILEHVVTNIHQGTQMIVARPKRSNGERNRPVSGRVEQSTA